MSWPGMDTLENSVPMIWSSAWFFLGPSLPSTAAKRKKTTHQQTAGHSLACGGGGGDAKELTTLELCLDAMNTFVDCEFNVTVVLDDRYILPRFKLAFPDGESHP